MSGICLLQPCLQAEESLDFTFSGTITDIDAELKPRIDETFIFSGSLQFTDREVDLTESSAEGHAVYLNFIEAAEFTLDENYILKEEGVLGQGDSEAKVFDRDPESEESDLVKILIPVEPAEAKLGDYNPAWIELFFYDDMAEMLNSTALPRHKLAFTSAGFRLSFFNKETQLLNYVNGVLDIYGPHQAIAENRDDRLVLENIIIELNTVILAQRQTIRRLETELLEAKSEIANLREALESAEIANAYPRQNDQVVEKLKAEIDSLVLVIEEIETKEKNAQTKIDDLINERSKLMDANATISQDLQEISVSLVDAKDEIEETKNIIAALNREITEKDKQIDSIKTELVNTQQTVATFTAPSSVDSVPVSSDTVEIMEVIESPLPAVNAQLTNESYLQEAPSQKINVRSRSKRFGPKRR